MKVIVGSKNPAKVEAVREILADYPHLMDAEVVGMEVDSGVPNQPTSLEEVTGGAVNRARNAYIDCDYAIGLEAGFFKVPHAKSGYMNVSAAAVFDGKDVHLGLSSAFETPDIETMRLVVEEGHSFAEAANATGVDTDPELGKKSGVIGALTRGKVNRKEYVQQSLVTALLHVDTRN